MGREGLLSPLRFLMKICIVSVGSGEVEAETILAGCDGLVWVDGVVEVVCRLAEGLEIGDAVTEIGPTRRGGGDRSGMLDCASWVRWQTVLTGCCLVRE